MDGKTRKIRIPGLTFALALSVALFIVPTALGFDGRSPDTRDAADQAQLSSLVDGRSPDTIDAGYQARLGSVGALVDGRSPDTLDAASQARTQVIQISSGTGFNWGDFGIGAAVAVGALFILIGLGVGMREARHVRQRLGSA